MGQEADKSGYELREEKAGTVKIADDVVAMIAALAATVFYLKRRQKALAVTSDDTDIVELPDDEK